MTEQGTPAGGGAREQSNVGYTRAAVDKYLQDVARRRADLEHRITEARARTARAELAVTRLSALEHAVGASLVAAYAQHVVVARRRGQVLPATGAAREPMIDLTAADEVADDGEDELADLGGDLPDGFGDEFFGPLTNGSTNGTRVAAEVRRG